MLLNQKTKQNEILQTLQTSFGGIYDRLCDFLDVGLGANNVVIKYLVLTSIPSPIIDPHYNPNETELDLQPLQINNKYFNSIRTDLFKCIQYK